MNGVMHSMCDRTEISRRLGAALRRLLKTTTTINFYVIVRMIRHLYIRVCPGW